MPTVEELDRLQALSRRLIPLSQAARGELIRAEQWNAVVSALIEVARAVATGERPDIVPEHDHSDQVKLSWLEPRVRALIESGPLSDPVYKSQHDALGRRVDEVLERIDGVGEALEGLRGRVTEVRVGDLQREQDVTDVRRQLEGLVGARDEIASLRESLGAIRGDVGTVLEIADRFEVDGELVDLQDVTRRLAEVEELRQRLVFPDGEAFDAAALERRLTELTNTLVTEDELDAALDARPGRVTDAQRAELMTDLQGRVQEQFRGELAASEDRLRREQSERLGQVDSLIERAVADVRGELERRAREVAGALITEARGEIEASVRQDTQSQLTALRDELGARLERDLDAMSSRLSEELNGRLDASFDERVRPLIERQGALERDLAAVQERIELQDAAVGRQDARISEVAAAAERARAALQANVRAELARQREEVAQRLQALDDGLDARIASAMDARQPALVDAARGALSEELQRIEVDLQQRIGESTRAAVTAMESRVMRSINRG